jgi:RNA polymerase sigma-70 factor (ECF subfamily)
VTDSDSELLDRLRAGDEQAFAVLVRRYQAHLLRLACSLVDNRSVAEEAVQDTWMGVVRGIERFEGRSSVKTWLFRILVNRTRSAAGREHRAEPAASETQTRLDERFDRSGAWLSPPASWAEDAEDRLVAEDLARRARACLDRLPVSQRQAVLLRDVDGMSAEEVCSTLGISDGNLRVLLHRGRARVRGMLDAEMGKG